MEIISKFNITAGLHWQGIHRAGWIEPNRRLYDNELVWFSRGSCRVITENGSFECGTGTLLVIPPEVEHCTLCLSDCARWCIHFDWYGTCPAYQNGMHLLGISDFTHIFEPEFSAEPYPGEVWKQPVCLKFSGSNFSHPDNLFRSFFSVTGNTDGARLSKLGVLHQILGFLLESQGFQQKEPGQKSTFFHAKQLIDRNFSDSSLALAGAAETLRITPNHFNKLFHLNLGVSAKTYLLNRRLLHARELLCNSRLSVGEIALLCGFSDVNYFIRCFREKNGISPGKFRRSSLE